VTRNGEISIKQLAMNASAYIAMNPVPTRPGWRGSAGPRRMT
jgi:hypothetical protein